MTPRSAKNVAASVRQRLLNLAKQRGKRYNDLLQHYALERWLFRLSQSEHSRLFVLKGALMLSAWNIPITRPTRDIDLLASASKDLKTIHGLIAAICRTPVDDDGLVFDHKSVETVRIAEDADYSGVRATFQGSLGTARLPMQIDMGFSDVVTPAPVEIEYPTVMDMPAPKLRAYNRETAIAEKFEAMVKIGELNSRMKDFFDIWALASTNEFDGMVLLKAITRTFERRGTPMKTAEVCFSESFSTATDKAAQWNAFVNRGELVGAPANFKDVWIAVMTFLRPVGIGIETNQAFALTWPAGGPWRQRLP